jgi:hypothetical protein
MACSRTETVHPRTAALPAVCDRTQFQAAFDEFERIAYRRDEILGRADSYPLAEPAEYLRLVRNDEDQFRGLEVQARAIQAPRCLRAATEIYSNYMDKSRIALEARRPGDEPSTYRQKRETADTIYGQFKTEVGQQRKNAQ